MNRSANRSVNRSPFKRMAGASTVLALLTLAGLPSVASAANTHPTVYQLHDPGPVSISQANNPAAFAELTVPADQWVAWAKLDVFTDGNTRRVRCWLTASNGSNRIIPASVQAGFVTLMANDTDTISLSASMSSPSHTVTFSLRCRDETGRPATIQPRAQAIRIMVMRLSTLRQTEIADMNAAVAGTSGGASGSLDGDVQPTAAPAQLIHGYRFTDNAIPKSSVPETIATLPLEAGLWSVRTSFSVVSLTGNATGEPLNRGYCRIVLNTSAPMRPSTGADRVFVNVLDPGHEEDRQAYYLDTAGSLSVAGSVRLQCWQTEGTGDLVVRSLRVTALKLGTLKVGSASTGSASFSYGSSLPLARHARTQEAFHISGDVETTVGRLKLTAGRWFVFAKVDWNGSWMSCSVHVGNQSAGTSDTLGDELSTQVIGTLSEPGQATLTCQDIGQTTPAEVSYVHITAIRVKAPRL